MIVFFMLYWNRTFSHHMITAIAMAAYTFTAFTVAIVNVIKYRKYNSPVFLASKVISFASACVSMLTLTSTLLTTFDERASLLEEMGVDMLFSQPFTEEMRQMPPEVYVGELMRRFHPVDVVCGYNHTFGKDGAGTSAFLAALGDALGFHTQVVPQVTLEGADVSSSAIRAALRSGDAAKAARLLGRPYQMDGQLLASENSQATFAPSEPRKQQPGPGKYRCLLTCSDDNKTWPCVVMVADGQPWKIKGIGATASQKTKLRILAKG